MSSEITLSKIIETKHLVYMNGNKKTLTEITFDVLKEMFLAHESKHLSSECVLFLHCKNSTGHMSNIIKRVFLMEDDIDHVISNEITEILNELQESNSDKDESIMYLKEELKQVIFRRVGQIHAHINSVDIEVNHIKSQLDDMSQISQEQGLIRMVDEKLSGLERVIISQNKVIQSFDERTRDIVGSMIGTLVPTIIEDIMLSSAPLQDIKESLNKVTVDMKSIKKTVLNTGEITRPKSINSHPVKTPQRFENAGEDQSFF